MGKADKASNLILEGRICVLINGSPYALVVPAVFVDFLSSPEDLNLKYQYSNLLRIVRIFAFFFAVFLPRIICSNY